MGYFLRSGYRGREEVHSFAEGLLDLGPTVVIGGMLRDLCLSGNKEFDSDVDFVIQPASISQFERIMNLQGASRNRFGGYGLRLGRWKVDVWPLERTWAAVNHHIDLSSLDDLTQVTFFNWDAIVYSLETREITTRQGYFDGLQDRFLEINLEPNPNPLGNAVRAIRYVCRWQAGLGPRLANHVAREIHDHGWDALIAAEREGFSDNLLTELDGEAIATSLRHLDREDRCAISLPILGTIDEPYLL